MLSENATLKAGLQLVLAEPKGRDARLTMEDLLREMCESLGFDLLVVSSSEGTPLAGVIRLDGSFGALNVARLQPLGAGLIKLGERTFQIASTPINQAQENLGFLAIGEPFDFSGFTTPAILAREGKVIKSSLARVSSDEMEQALAGCRPKQECEMRLAGETYLSSPVQSLSLDGGYELRTLQSVDRATGTTQAILRGVFLIAGGLALIAAFAVSLIASRTIVGPLTAVITRLRSAESTGMLPEFPEHALGSTSPAVVEIRELMVSFNHAAHAHRESRRSLLNAYVEFVGALASALDARDHYTAGHSRRVSEYSCALAAAIGMPVDVIAELRIAALLHDIGKIGIPDAVLQKPGKLTSEEFTLIQQHPIIGCRILAGVNGFAPFLPVVELHHENWDGTGYPLGLIATAVPLNARIVHVADAYDAMTSDRPYRRGMSHEDAIHILEQHAGTQFDPHMVAVFVKLECLSVIRCQTHPPAVDSIQRLAEILDSSEPQMVLNGYTARDET
ncbi:MAG: HD-GYP domain-containing protein [Acidobacteria bacterium]|nr:HD-GYP domain-containing protein [Acidobacteriota bacterium]